MCVWVNEHGCGISVFERWYAGVCACIIHVTCDIVFETNPNQLCLHGQGNKVGKGVEVSLCKILKNDVM